MPIDYNKEGELTYKPNQTDRNRIERAIRIACMLQEYGGDKDAKTIGTKARDALACLRALIEPPTNGKTDKEPEQ